MQELDENCDIGNLTPSLKKVERTLRAMQRRTPSEELERAMERFQEVSGELINISCKEFI